jgi:methylthioribose-1-phosphate isomerase
MAERTFPRPVDDSLRALSGDRVLGASSLLGTAAGAFFALSSASPATNARQFVSESEDLVREIIAVQPLMAPFYNLGAAVLKGSDTSLSLPRLRKAVSHAATRYAEEAEKGQKIACRAGAGIVRDGARILTISSSSAVLGSFELAKKDWKKFCVIVLESRPMLEGRIAARKLAALHIPVEIVTDAALASEVRRADQVLIGADSLTEEVLVNKMGTLAVAMTAKEAGVPIFSVADGSKLLPDAILPEVDRSRNPNEVWEGAPQGVTVRNRYFERVPQKYIRTFAMEDGPCKTEDIARKLEKMAPGMEKLAGILGISDS